MNAKVGTYSAPRDYIKVVDSGNAASISAPPRSRCLVPGTLS